MLAWLFRIRIDKCDLIQDKLSYLLSDSMKFKLFVLSLKLESNKGDPVADFTVYI